jgi:hypothetical protein
MRKQAALLTVTLQSPGDSPEGRKMPSQESVPMPQHGTCWPPVKLGSYQ